MGYESLVGLCNLDSQYSETILVACFVGPSVGPLVHPSVRPLIRLSVGLSIRLLMLTLTLRSTVCCGSGPKSNGVQPSSGHNLQGDEFDHRPQS